MPQDNNNANPNENAQNNANGNAPFSPDVVAKYGVFAPQPL